MTICAFFRCVNFRADQFLSKFRRKYINAVLSVASRTFKIEAITISIFYFCIGLVTQPNGPVLVVLKHHYITKRIRELLSGNSRFLI